MGILSDVACDPKRTRQDMSMRQNAELARLEECLDHIRAAPADGGTVELIARKALVRLPAGPI
jgi:hypothetical protein